MPLLNIFTSAKLPDAESGPALLKTLSAELAKALHKPERYVMTCLTPRPLMTFGGSEEPACYVELKNVGSFTPEATSDLSGRLCAVLSEQLGVAKDRIYVEFNDAKPHLWGFDGDTFA